MFASIHSYHAGTSSVHQNNARARNKNGEEQTSAGGEAETAQCGHCTEHTVRRPMYGSGKQGDCLLQLFLHSPAIAPAPPIATPAANPVPARNRLSLQSPSQARRNMYKDGKNILRAGEAQYLEIQALPFLDSFFILSHLASLTWHLSQRARTRSPFPSFERLQYKCILPRPI